jgi:uncharacterized protein YlaI
MSKKNTRKSKRSGIRSCEICEVVTPLQEHHLRGRKIPNANSSFNLTWICPTCHDRTHLGLIIIEGWFSTTDGEELIWHNEGEPSITGLDIIPPKYGH